MKFDLYEDKLIRRHYAGITILGCDTSPATLLIIEEIMTIYGYY